MDSKRQAKKPHHDPRTRSSAIFAVRQHRISASSHCRGLAFRFRSPAVLAVLIALGIGPWHGAAQETAASPSRLPDNPGANIRKIVAAHGKIFFIASNALYGEEVWVYDVEKGQVELTRDIARGDGASDAEFLGVFGDSVYFRASCGEYGTECWKSDGTEAGTQLVCDINPSLVRTLEPKFMVPFQDYFVFVANDGVHGPELWRSDGTAPNTRMIMDIHPSSDEGHISFCPVRFGDLLFFRARPGKVNGELWRTDGTAEGTFRIEVPGLSIEAFLYPMYALDHCLVFAGRTDATGLELWRTDGTVQGTRLIADVFPGAADSKPIEMARLGNVVYLQAHDPANGSELWRTDGTPDGTYMVADIEPGGLGSDPGIFVAAGDRLYFAASTLEHGCELYVTDGTREGTHLVLDVMPDSESGQPYGIAANGNRVYFSVETPGLGEELWITDGTPQGTSMVRDIWPGPDGSEPHGTVTLDGIAYFQANEGIHGQELWRSDGTAAGTYLIADISRPASPPPSADPQLLTVEDGALDFIAREQDGLYRIWHSDGTGDGTARLCDFPANYRGEAFLGLYPSGSTLYAVCMNQEGAPELWRVDYASGAADAVARMASTPDGIPADCGMFTEVNSSAYFCGLDPEHGAELWKIPPDTRETHLLHDLNPGAADGTPRYLTPLGDCIYFVADTAELGEELWMLEGDKPRLVADLCPGPDGSSPRSLLPVGDNLYFTADDGVHGPEVWVTSRSTSEARLVADINPIQHANATRPSSLTVLGDAVYFSASDSVHGVELWKTQGDAQSTTLVKDLFVGRASSNPELLTVAGDRLYFRAESANQGVELFVSNGTEQGTYQMQDLADGPASSHPTSLHAAGSILLLSANMVSPDGATAGTELHWTNGGNVYELDILGGTGGSYPAHFRNMGNRVLCVLTNQFSGRELWTLTFGPDGGKPTLELLKDILPPEGTSYALKMTAPGSKGPEVAR